MKVAIIEEEAYKTLILKLEEIYGEIQFCRKWIESSSSFKKENIHNRDWLEEDEVVELLGLNRRTLLRLRKTGGLKYSRCGESKVIYYRKHIDEYLEEKIQDNSKSDN